MQELLAGLQANPFVGNASKKTIWFRQELYDSAALLAGLPADDILRVFLIDPVLLTEKEKSTFIKRLSSTKPVSCSDIPFFGKTVFDAHVLFRRMEALKAAADLGFREIAEELPSMRPFQKKQLCLWIASLPQDPEHIYTLRDILKRVGIFPSEYYRYVNDEEFGLGEVRKKHKDDLDAETVRMVFEYRGFRKGARQVCMLMHRITGRKMALKKIRRLMKAYGMDSGIRTPKKKKQTAQELLSESTMPNILRRTFRLHRPNEVRVTDVTFLDYGDGLRAYGSAMMDPVTSRLIAFYISERNDLEMALETLRLSDSHPCADCGIFHSDQGSLYRNGKFRKEVLERGLRQSMSKKGNCWDNATQESFFGHFKDECDYKSCRDVTELREMVAEYGYYYNNERGLWDRKHMTPVEYEEYLLALSDEEFSIYLAQEEKKYNEMKKRAAALAKKRYGTLGV